MGRETVQPIIGPAPQATCWHGRVTSNVRRHAQVPVRASGPPCEHRARRPTQRLHRPTKLRRVESHRPTLCPLAKGRKVRLTSALRASVLRRAVRLSAPAEPSNWLALPDSQHMHGSRRPSMPAALLRPSAPKERCLTLRSRRGPTALAREAPWYILRLAGQCRRSRLTSNVRPRENHCPRFPRVQGRTPCMKVPATAAPSN